MFEKQVNLKDETNKLTDSIRPKNEIKKKEKALNFENVNKFLKGKQTKKKNE